MVKRSTLFVFFFVAATLFWTCVPSNVGSGEFRYANRINLGTLEELYRFLTYSEESYPLVSAHRGGPSAGFPENAIETFENNFRRQPLIIECDVRITKDSVLVLMHDETLERTTNGSGAVAQHEWAALRKLRLKDPEGRLTPFRIPTLDDALQWGKGKVLFTLDVKRDVPYTKVIQAVRKSRAEAYSIIITYNADQAAAVHQLAPELMISASIRSSQDLLRLNDRHVPDNRLVAFVGTSEVDKKVYEMLHGHGILCILGTMGNLDKQAALRGDTVYTGLIERGADILSTDRPTEAGRAIQGYRRTIN